MYLKPLLILLTLQSGMISKYVSEQEAYKSPTAIRLGINNTPSSFQKETIKQVSLGFFDKLRERIGSPLYISSMYRSPNLNKAVKGASNSDHMLLGDVVAIDIDQDNKGRIPNSRVFDVIRKEFMFTKLIWEGGGSPYILTPEGVHAQSPDWVHVAYSTDPEKNKLRKVYRMVRQGYKVIYTIIK